MNIAGRSNQFCRLKQNPDRTFASSGSHQFDGPVRRPSVEVARRASYHFGGSATMETSVKSIIDKLGYSWCASTRPIPAQAE